MKFIKLVKAEEIDPKEKQFYQDIIKQANEIASKHNCKITKYEIFEQYPGVINKETPFMSIKVDYIGDIYYQNDFQSNNDLILELNTNMGTNLERHWTVEEIRNHLNKCNRVLDCLEELKETFFK